MVQHGPNGSGSWAKVWERSYCWARVWEQGYSVKIGVLTPRHYFSHMEHGPNGFRSSTAVDEYLYNGNGHPPVQTCRESF